MRHMHRGHHEEVRDYPKMPVTIDHNFVMSEFVGPANGLQEDELAELNPGLEDLDRQLKGWRADGEVGFLTLPYDEEIVKQIKKLARQFKEWCRDVLVLGLGSSAIGARALQQALCHPAHNFFPIGRRQYHSRLFVADTIDPDSLYGLLDDLELKRLVVNVISKSGATPGTMANFLIVYDLLQGRLGEAKAKESFLFITDPQEGGLRRLADAGGFPSLSFPVNVTGGFSIFSAAGLFPAAMAGIDIEGLLAGARFMDQRLQESPASQNLAYRLAACYYLISKRKGRSIQVIMPFADSLAGVAHWFCRLWAESLGEKIGSDGAAGLTPMRAVGATDQHSLGQLLMAGPTDKIITFLEVEKFQHALPIPSSYPDIDSLNYLGGRRLAELPGVHKQSLAFNLMKNGRPNLTIKLPEINAFTIGQLLYLWEVTVAAMGALLHVNPFDQSGFEVGEKTTFGLIGRTGYESQKEEFDKAPPLQNKYIL